MSRSPIALLYDIHGNLAALEAVLAEAEGAGAAGYVLGGDYAGLRAVAARDRRSSSDPGRTARCW